MKALTAAVIGLLSVVSLSASSDARLAPRRAVLENGLVVLTSEQRALPMVTFNLLIEAGSRFENAGREGTANLAARLLTYGTRTRTATQISEALDFIGATLSAACDEETATVSLTVLKKDLQTGLELFTDVLTASTFPQAEIDRQKQSVIASIRAKQEEPGEIAQEKFREALFRDSAYGRPVEGTSESVERVDRGALLQFYEQYYRPNRAILAVVGDVSHEEILGLLQKLSRSWERRNSPSQPPPTPSPAAAAVIRVNKDLTQANILIGHDGVPRNHPDYYAIQVMNYILGGGGFSSRLMDSIRNERGLAYSVYSAFDTDKYAGSFQLAMQTKNESAGEAIRVAMEEIRKIREQGVTQEELQAAKDYLTGSFPLRFDSNRRVGAFLTQMEYFGLGLDYMERYADLIRGISREEVLRVAQSRLQPDKWIVVVVADQSKAGLNNSLDRGKGP
jgi:zinc protease